ncbi:hypothetical protein [Pontimicrobium sp. MEBiC06410]
MSNSISMLCTELKEALGDNKLSLPNSKVSAVQVDSFLKNILKTDSIAFTNASVTCKGNCITLKGDFRLFGIQLSANWGFSEGADGTITWQFGASTNDASTINSIVTHFLAKTYHLPSSFSGLPVNNIGFQAKINTSDKDYSLDLKAKTSWGDVELYVQKNSGVWGAALGVGVSKGFTLTKIDSNLSLFDDLEFSDSAIVVSDFTNKKLKISGITGVVDGAEFKSTLAVEANSSPSALPKIVNELAKSLSDIPVEISIDLTVTKDYEITAEIDKSFSFPGISSLMLNSIAMTIKSSPITAILSGDVSLPITIPAKPTVHSINVNGGISFTYSDGTVRAEATINSDTVINEPFDFYGVTLEDVGIGIDVSFGAETGAGVTLEGAFLLGESKTKLDEKFAISIEFTDDTPNPSLLYCETKNLSLPVIFNAVIDTGIKLPSVLSDFSYNDLMFYWCDEAQTLPDGTSCQVGIGYNAGINFWGFDTYSSLMINQGSGISGEASVNPIHLFNNKISLTGKGKAGHGIKANGPFFKFNTTEESFDVSVDADILGITEVINAKVSPTALDINMKSNLKFLEDSLSVEFKNGGTTMAFDSSLSISIACKPSIKIGGINLGTIPINDSMNGTIDVSFINGSLSAKVDAHFDFNGTKFGFNYDLGASVTDLKDLASVIENKIVSEAESIFSSYFSKVENYISVVGKGLITGGEFVVNVLYHVYTHSIIDTFKVLANLPTKFHVNGTLDFPIKIAPSIPSESVHVDLGKIVDHHADLHTDHWGLNFHEFNEHADLGASKTISTPSFDVTILDIDPKQHFDMVMPPSVHVNATSPRIGLDPHLDASLVGGSLGITGTVGVNATVDLTDINLDADARFNITGHAGVHADVAHIGVHGDKNTHIDAPI